MTLRQPTCFNVSMEATTTPIELSEYYESAGFEHGIMDAQAHDSHLRDAHPTMWDDLAAAYRRGYQAGWDNAV